MSRYRLVAALIILSVQAQTPADVYRSAKDAVVLIEGRHKQGTGFLVSDDGLVVTNYHVVSGETVVKVKLASGLELETSEIAAWDSYADVAVLQLRGKGFPKLTLADSSRVSPGDSVLVISNPLGLEESISNGLVSGIRTIADSKLLQITAPISHGSSGAPVLDMKGRVIGMASGTLEGGQNLNLAIPASVLKRVIETLKPTTLGQTAKDGSQQSQPDFQRLKRYATNSMWSEALTMLKDWASTDEFDPGVRFALGTVELHLLNFDEAVAQLELSRRLDSNIWQSVDNVATAHFDAWAINGEARHRTAACASYRALLALETDGSKIETPTQLVSLFARGDDLLDAQRRARKNLEILNSVAGKWQDGKFSYEAKKSGSGWWLTSDRTEGPANTSLNLQQRDESGGTGKGWETVGECLMEVSVEFKIADCGSGMVISERFTGNAAWVGEHQDFNDFKSRSRACQYVASKENSEVAGPARELDLRRP